MWQRCEANSWAWQAEGWAWQASREKYQRAVYCAPAMLLGSNVAWHSSYRSCTACSGPKQQRCAELQCATAPHKWPGTLRTPPVPPANKRKKCHKCSQGCNVVLACCAHTATGPAGSSPTATGSTPFLFKCSIDALPHLVSLGVSVAKALPPVWHGALQANKTTSRWSFSAARQGSEPQQGAAGQAGAAPTAASGLRQYPQTRTQQEQSMARLQLHG